MINSYSTRQPCLLLEVHLEVHNVTLPPGNSLIFTYPYLLGYLVYEPEIMANKNQTPRPTRSMPQQGSRWSQYPNGSLAHPEAACEVA
ncbi:hypothetical protein OIU74_008461 [Salix koriyanagi]|uniref:Uncharacterized protein n=1 Tax=Salix koriyanagi TaxID=2511006 RepID=A0A9Q0TQ14_9ROSI|nr:hypothetical protein OIU74_008461 [Salix koriyanagi]